MSRKRLCQYPLVEVIWEDVTSRNRWDSFEGHRECPLIVCFTTGYLIAAKKGVVRVAQTLSFHREEENNASDVINIPRRMIRRMRTVRR